MATKQDGREHQGKKRRITTRDNTDALIETVRDDNTTTNTEHERTPNTTTNGTLRKTATKNLR